MKKINQIYKKSLLRIRFTLWTGEQISNLSEINNLAEIYNLTQVEKLGKILKPKSSLLTNKSN